MRHFTNVLVFDSRSPNDPAIRHPMVGMIALATHGRGGVKRLALGSVAGRPGCPSSDSGLPAAEALEVQVMIAGIRLRGEPETANSASLI